MRFAVVGDPVDHSRSPAIHTAGFAAVGLEATYEAVQIPSGGFASVVSDLRSGRFAGVNVTMPHKDDAYAAVDERDVLAARSRSVNTIIASGGRLHGYNTDVDGVRYAIELLELPDDLPVLVLGYGGAARAAIVAMTQRVVYVSGRDERRAGRLVESIDESPTIVPWGSGVDGAIVINATPLGMGGECLPEPTMAHAAGLLDMAYGADPTATVAWAGERGIPHADGIDMLTGQAFRAFELFTGLPAPRDVMALAARSQ